MRLVAIEMIDETMKLAKNVYLGECLILKKGTRNLNRYIENFANMKIRYVYVEDKKSRDIVIPDAISEETRYTCKNTLTNTIMDFNQGNTLKLVKLSGSIDSIIAEITANNDVQISLSDISAADEYTFTHSVNVAVYSLLMGRGLKYSRKKLQMLAMGSLLHDIGKTILDHEIVYKEGALSDDEFEYVKKHTICGYEVLRDCPNVPVAAKEIALNHHEKLDGTGYPRGIKDSELNEFARITSIADVYDALTTDRCYRKKWSTNKALDFLIENSDTKFDPDLIRIFMQRIAIYPNGSMVRLSDGSLAIVMEQNKYAPLRPIVRVTSDKYGKEITPYVIDLMKILSVTVIESEIEIDQSTFVQDKDYFMGDECDK